MLVVGFVAAMPRHPIVGEVLRMMLERIDTREYGTSFEDVGGNTWSLDTTSGADQVLWEYSTDGTLWHTFTMAAPTLFTLKTGISVGDTVDIFFRLTMPTTTTSEAEKSATVTIVAVEP